MLELRPSCEQCNKPLPPNSTEAMICTFECTFCRDCVEKVLLNVCPNCGGGFTPRPVRPATNWKDGNHLSKHPASDKVVYKPVDPQQHEVFSQDIKNIAPEKR
ncbi:DUF1272 domain-containing protein [Kangiella sediminilitoris]|uniref:Urease n=1 Tax=Kangiella sediminilitoris TaxID=1144748 RepID=A0A1B3BDU1_9GAMM|nr:DUF1272 domain-containing protein [Kangiella sediminilitoris]AOE51004.1 hypothetical protein KS2013_2300 [Kangiella sediminilitoris]